MRRPLLFTCLSLAAVAAPPLLAADYSLLATPDTVATLLPKKIFIGAASH